MSAVIKEDDSHILPIYRKTLTRLSGLNLVNLELKFTFDFDGSGNFFSLTVFDKRNNVIFFNFYSFYTEGKITDRINRIITSLKKDDHELLKKECGDIN